MAIQAYQLLSMGTGYTYREIQDMEYYDFAVITTCRAADMKAQESSMHNSAKGVENVKYAEGVNAHWQ